MIYTTVVIDGLVDHSPMPAADIARVLEPYAETIECYIQRRPLWSAVSAIRIQTANREAFRTVLRLIPILVFNPDASRWEIQQGEKSWPCEGAAGWPCAEALRRQEGVLVATPEGRPAIQSRHSSTDRLYGMDDGDGFELWIGGRYAQGWVKRDHTGWYWTDNRRRVPLQPGLRARAYVGW